MKHIEEDSEESRRDRKENKNKEKKEGNFRCGYCSELTTSSEYVGTHHRNHCPGCLWSKHVDKDKSGDRQSTCGAMMEPVGITFKQEGSDKYGRVRQGELMIVHVCSNAECEKISINRIAGDDNSQAIINVFEQSELLSDELKKCIKDQGITLVKREEEAQIRTQLFGRI